MSEEYRIIDPIAIALRHLGLRDAIEGKLISGNAMLQAAQYIERLRVAVHMTRADVLDEVASFLEMRSHAARPDMKMALGAHATDIRQLGKLEREDWPQSWLPTKTVPKTRTRRKKGDQSNA